jgi:hypothetical protein
MRRLLAILVAVMAASGASAGGKPLQLSLTPDIALFDRGEAIEGLTLGIWSENPQSALALGIVNGVVNCAGRLTGLQLGLINYAATADSGVQIGLVNLIPQNPWFSGLPGEFAPGMVLVNWRL